NPESARRSSPVHFLRKRRSSWAKIGRSACADRSLSQRGSHFNCSRFLFRRSARNTARNKSPRRDHKPAGLDVEHRRKAIMTSTTPKKVRVPDLALMKQRGDRIVMLTAYDATMARLLGSIPKITTQ